MAKSKGPFLRARPNPVPAGESGLGTTTIAWSTGDGSPGVVAVQAGEEEEVLFAQGARGEAAAAWIVPGVVYTFRLYSRAQKGNGALRELTVQVAPGAPGRREPVPLTASEQTEAMRSRPSITASPNPIPDSPGPELGSTSITWRTGDGSVGWVYLLTTGNQEVLFASGPSGTRPAPWVQRNFAYRFTLYADEGRSRKLASVTVTRGSPRRELALDLAVVGGAAVAVVTPVVVAALTLRRVVRKVFPRE